MSLSITCVVGWLVKGLFFLSIQMGGVGIWNLKVFNKALSRKWLRWFALELDRLWRMGVEDKYGIDWGIGPLAEFLALMGWSSQKDL